MFHTSDAKEGAMAATGGRRVRHHRDFRAWGPGMRLLIQRSRKSSGRWEA